MLKGGMIRPMDTIENYPEQPTVGYFFAGKPQREEPMALAEIHGDKWCVLGNSGVSDVMDDPFVYSKLQVFGFPLEK